MIRFVGTAIAATLLFTGLAAAEPGIRDSRPVTHVNELCHLGPSTSIGPEYLDQCRPRPISQAQKQGVLRRLPSEGEVHELDRSQRRKLEALAAALGALGRDYEVKIIDVPQAFAGLYAKAVLLISLPALQLLNAEELQAIAAHEAGHEYFWEEYEVARNGQDEQRLRELELNCDAIAAFTLLRLGLPSNRLIGALEKLYSYNHRRFGLAVNESSYPSLTERRKAVARLAGPPISGPR